ncbi:MAG: hypothetical protein V4629_10480 [Pseudomonadota bacterium]
MTNKNSHSVVEVKKFTLFEIDQGIAKLKRRIDEVQGLVTANVPFGDARANTARSNIRESIREIFGSNSPEFQDH